MYYVGVDIGKRFNEASIIDQLGNQFGKKSLKFSNSHTGGNKLIDYIKSNTNNSTEIFIGIEYSGHY